MSRAGTGLIVNWRPLVQSGYLPVAEWGDGWGPVCLDLRAPRSAAEDAPLVWFDHEILVPMGEDACAEREEVLPHAQSLHESFRAFLEDVFSMEGSK